MKKQCIKNGEHPPCTNTGCHCGVDECCSAITVYMPYKQTLEEGLKKEIMKDINHRALYFELPSMVYDNYTKWLNQTLTTFAEKIRKSVEEEVNILHRNSESRSSELECSQEGYEYGLEDVLAQLKDK